MDGSQKLDGSYLRIDLSILQRVLNNKVKSVRFTVDEYSYQNAGDDVLNDKSKDLKDATKKSS